MIPAVAADFCPARDESITDMAETERVMREMQAFNKQVNAAIVDPVFIVNVRKKLDLGQREAAEIFGGGINAFSRYESSLTKPPLALVKLLKGLDRRPAQRGQNRLISSKLTVSATFQARAMPAQADHHVFALWDDWVG